MGRRLDSYDDFIYPNIAKFLEEADISLYEFSKWCGVERNRLRKQLCGKAEFKKPTIDKLLEQLEMTYEEAFQTK